MNNIQYTEVIKHFHNTTFATPIIGVTSTKRGVGKSTVAANLATAFVARGKKVALLNMDTDVPTDNLLGLPLDSPEPITVIQPIFDQTKCMNCNECVKICRVDRLPPFPENNIITTEECDDCEACHSVCPANAIGYESRSAGTLYKNEQRNLTLYTGIPQPGATENSSIMVNAVRKAAFTKAALFDVILVNTKPGVHQDMINALQGADHVLAVADPAQSNDSHLEHLLSLLDQFAVQRSVMATRSGLLEKRNAELSPPRNGLHSVAVDDMADRLIAIYLDQK